MKCHPVSTLQHSLMAPVGLVNPRLRPVPLVLYHPHSGILMVHLAINRGQDLLRGRRVYALLAVR